MDSDYSLMADEKTSLIPLIECRTLYGRKKLVLQSELTIRPAVYAVVFHEDKLLLCRECHTGKYCLPGGGVEAGERMVDALKREVKEETGIEVEIEELLHFEEDFFYYNPANFAIHGFLFFYACRAQTLKLVNDDQVEDEAVEKPRWVPVHTLKPEDYHPGHAQVVELARTGNRR